jgi:hypothetical protein
MWSRIGLIAAAFSLSAPRALACSCSVAIRAVVRRRRADIIVRATVASREVNEISPPFGRPAPSGGRHPASRPTGTMPPREPWGRVKVTLTVSERFRGAVGDSLVVQTEVGTDACGYPFEVGHEYLVFANENQGSVTVTTCSATQPAKMATARIQPTALSSRRNLSTGPVRVRGYTLAWRGPNGWEQVQPMPGLIVMRGPTTRSTAPGPPIMACMNPGSAHRSVSIER